MQGRPRRRAKIVLAACALTGTLLGVIGIRYLLSPESAAGSFGLPGQPAGHELHYIIGLRNLWLGALAVGLAALRQWHGLAVWFSIGGFVCFADARLVANATGTLPQIAFHLGCGVVFWFLAAVCWRSGNKRR
jgi:Domain of unknown function (DUF4267)